MKAAQRLMTQVQAAIVANVYRREDFFEGGKKGVAQSFGDYADEWLKTLTVAKSTLRSYKTALDATWKPALGDLGLAQIRYSDVKKAVADKAKTASGKTVNNHLIVLRGIFEMALKDGLLSKDPTAGIENLSHQAAQPDPFTKEELAKVLAHMEAKFPQPVWNYFTFAFHTGMRPSEIIALQWGDIDWTRSKARVQRARVDWEDKGTKTNRERDVDLSDPALAALKRQKEHSFMRGSEAQVFTNPNTTKPWPDEQVQRRRYFTPTLRALGLRHRDAYQARHTFATLLLMGGINPAYISKQLGHTTPQMLFKVYARWIDGADKGAEAAKANALLGGGGPELSRNRPRAEGED